MDWRSDMVNAPKDGTELIGYRPDQGKFVFRWVNVEEIVPRDIHGDPLDEYDEDIEGWWHDLWGWIDGELSPTHWMHFPSDPAPN